jgi:hypothetical protein
MPLGRISHCKKKVTLGRTLVGGLCFYIYIYDLFHDLKLNIINLNGYRVLYHLKFSNNMTHYTFEL